MRYTIVRVRGSDAKLEQALADAKSGKRKKRRSLRVLTTLQSVQSSNVLFTGPSPNNEI